MNSVLDVEISCFSSYAGKKPRRVNLLTWLSSDKYAGKIRVLRSLTDKPERDKVKASLPAITVSGIFDPTRKEEHLVKHSKLICIDIDGIGNEHIENFQALKKQLFHIENVAYAGLSASGKGFFLIMPIKYPKHHKEHFRAIRRDLAALGLAIDPAPQNVASLRGYSWDDQALFRHQAKPYRKRLKEDTGEKKKSKAGTLKPFVRNWEAKGTKSRVEELVNTIVNNRIDVTGSEPDWFRLACAFANEFGEGGREYFHTISQFFAGYDQQEADRKFDHASKGQYRRIGIGTFFGIVQSKIL